MTCKPNSVENGYLSSSAVADGVKRFRKRSEQTVASISCTEWGLQSLSRRRESGRLLPYLSILTPRKAGRFISVALSLKSPSPVVSRHSVPVVFGLSSHDERTQPFGHLICKSIHFSRAFWQAFTPVCVRFLLGAAIEFLGNFIDSLFFDTRYVTARYT